MPLDGLEPLRRRPAPPAAEIGPPAAWIVRLDLPPAALARLSGLLSSDELARADRLRRPTDRARFVAGRAQLRQLLGRRTGKDPAALRFEYSPAGKPSLAPGRGSVPLHFNASGSSGFALVALRCGAAVGVDLEAIRARPDGDALATRLLSGDERGEFLLLPETERTGRFFEYWARKEAAAKAIGTGLREGLDRLSLHPWPGNGTFRLDVAGREAPSPLWVAPLALPVPGFAAALASPRRFGTIDVQEWVD